MFQTETTCPNCHEVLVRSLTVPVWSHVSVLLAGSTRCEDGSKPIL